MKILVTRGKKTSTAEYREKLQEYLEYLESKRKELLNLQNEMKRRTVEIIRASTDLPDLIRYDLEDEFDFFDWPGPELMDLEPLSKVVAEIREIIKFLEREEELSE